MPTTPKYGLTYPALNSAPNVPLWMQLLAEDVEDAFDADALAAATTTAPAPGFDFDTVDKNAAQWGNSGHVNLPPGETSLIIVTYRISSTARLQIGYVIGSTPRVWQRFRGSVSWSAWTRTDALGVPAAIADAKAYADASPVSRAGAGTKVVPVALTVGTVATTWEGGAVGVRMPIYLAPTVTRYRVHVRNINPRIGTNQPGAVSLTGLWIGPESTVTAGTFTGAPTAVTGAVSTPADGSEWRSKWINVPLTGGTRHLLAYGINTTSTQQVVGGGWTVASPADAINNAAARTVRTGVPLDVWIEAEVAATTPVVAAWGDSLASGVGASQPVNESLVSQYARATGAIPVHYSASGDAASSWASDLTSYKWTRWAGLARPDALLAGMGSNDVFTGASLATLQADYTACIAQIAATITPAIYALTVTPRDAVTGAEETVRKGFNTWLKTLPSTLAVRDVFDVVPAVSADDETLTPALTSDGTHLTAAGYAAELATITRPLVPVPDNADTGWRSLQLGTDAASGTAYIRRVGSQVTFVVDITATASVGAISNELVDIPAGFKPSLSLSVYLFSSVPRSTFLQSNGNVQVYSVGVNERLRFASPVGYPTSEPWPITLPGTPA